MLTSSSENVYLYCYVFVFLILSEKKFFADKRSIPTSQISTATPRWFWRYQMAILTVLKYFWLWKVCQARVQFKKILPLPDSLIKLGIFYSICGSSNTRWMVSNYKGNPKGLYSSMLWDFPCFPFHTTSHCYWYLVDNIIDPLYLL